MLKNQVRFFTYKKGKTINMAGKIFECDNQTNITEGIISKMNEKLHLNAHHPVGLLKKRIQQYFDQKFTDKFTNLPEFKVFDDISPIVTTTENFDSVLVPIDHPSRSASDNYYINSTYLLRAHTTAHECDILKNNNRQFLTIGDVYRRDQIDKTHYPIFHQMEMVRLFKLSDFDNLEKGEIVKYVANDLKNVVESLFRHLFETSLQMRWVDAYFPFTHPSFELEVYFNEKNEESWTEMLGCGVLRDEILTSAGIHDSIGWAGGLGLDRIAMRKFGIPDIRLMWSKDKRFLDQFINNGYNTTFIPFSKYPSINRDISFWRSDTFQENNLNDVVRNYAGDLVEKVYLLDSYTHPSSGQTSTCYRLVYRSMEKSLTDEEVNAIQDKICAALKKEYKLNIR